MFDCHSKDGISEATKVVWLRGGKVSCVDIKRRTDSRWVVAQNCCWLS